MRSAAEGGSVDRAPRGTETSNGVGKPVGKQADEGADALGFVLWQLGVEVTASG